MRLYLEWFWLVCIFVIILNGVAIWRRTKPFRAADSSLVGGYKSILWRACLWLAAPCLFIGAAQFTGEIETVMDIFNSSPGPWVGLGFVSGVTSVVLFGVYIFFRGGAKTLSRYPGLLSKSGNFDRPFMWKIYALIILLSQVWFFVGIWMFGDFASQ